MKGDRDYTTVPVCGSGAAAMDSVINLVVPPGKEIAVTVNGAYGKRMVDRPNRTGFHALSRTLIQAGK